MALDQAFTVETLAGLRKAVLAEVKDAGMPDGLVVDVVLAVHELAVNAVRHGGGAGLARLRRLGGELHCEVTDAGPGSGDGHAGDGHAGDGHAGDRDTGRARSWPVRPGHGLWLVHEIADRVSMVCHLGGSRVTAVFALTPV